jgi:hypothetical protein
VSLNPLDEEALFAGFGDTEELPDAPVNPAKLSIVQSSYQDPDAAANDKRLSDESGLSMDLVRHDRDEVERQVGLSKLDLEALSPGLSTWLENPDNANVSYDDIPLLDELSRKNSERPWYDFSLGDLKGFGSSALIGMGKVYDQAMVAFLSDIDETKVNPAGFTPDIIAQRKADRGQQIKMHIASLGVAEDEIAKLTPEDLTVMGKGVRGGAQMIADMAPGLAISALTRGQVNITLPMLVGKTGLESYGSARVADRGHEEALRYGGIDALLELATEKIPTKLAEELFTKIGTGGLKETVGKFMLSEMGGEQVATFTQTMNALAHDLDEELANAKTFGEMADIQAERQVVTAISTLIGSGSISGTAYVADRAVNRDRHVTQAALKQVENRVQSEVAQGWLDNQIFLAQSSKLNERDNKLFAEYIEQLDPDNRIFLNADIAGQIENPPTYVTEQLDGTGADVSISLGNFLTDFVKDEALLEQVRPHVKVHERFLTQNEIEAETDNTQVKTLIEKANKDRDAKTEADTIFEQVKSQLVATGRMGEHTARLSSELIPAYVVTKQQELKARGIEASVKSLYEDMGLKIGGPKDVPTEKPDTTVLTQDEQTEYESAVAKGLPMDRKSREERAKSMGFDTGRVVYHGTSREGYVENTDIRAFDPEKIGDKWSADQQGYFFTSSKKFASDYAASDRDYHKPGEGEGAVYPVYLKMESPLIIDDVFLKTQNMAPIGVTEDSISFWDNYQSLVFDWMQEGKHDGVILRDDTFKSEDGKPTESHIVFDPSQIRSVNAAFDPEYSTSPTLLAQQKFGDLTLTDTGVDEAGNQVEVTEKAQKLWNHHQKRIKMVDNLRECINA